MNYAPRFAVQSFGDLPLRKVFVISLALLLAIFPTSLRAETELISNDKFSDDGASWKLTSGPKISANMSVEKVDGEAALCVAVDLGGEAEGAKEAVLVRIQRLFGEINASQNYRISFQVKAEKDADIVAYVSPEKDGARVLWRNQVAAGADWKEYSFTFAGKDSVPDCVFGFARLGTISNKYWFKDIVLSAE